MDPRTRALVLDFDLAVGAVVLGVLVTPTLSPTAFVLAVFGGSVCVAALWVAEQTDTLDAIDEYRPLSLVIVAAATLGVALGLILGRLTLPLPSGPLLIGMGVGLACYRTVYGLWRPLPECRLAQAGGAWRRENRGRE